MNTITRIILYPFKDLIGLGYSECNCCGFPWNLVKPHCIEIQDGRGASPVCEDCWNKRSIGEIRDAFNKCYDSWQHGDLYNAPLTSIEIGFTREEMLSALAKAFEAEVWK